MTAKELKKAVLFCFTGEWKRVWNEVHVRCYKAFHEFYFEVRLPRIQRPPLRSNPVITVETRNPIAYESPDHLSPSGTKENNNTHKKFVTLMHERLMKEFPGKELHFLDLGCSGGQLVADFKLLNWVAAGLEGSDYSLRHKRANWATLAGKNLFTCDITKPYQVKIGGEPGKFHLITAWEVLEHIATPDLTALFQGICRHLEPGGYFIASTTGTPDIHNGIELHQTQMSNAQWKADVSSRFNELEEADLGIQIYQYVRYNFLEPSFLIYRKKQTRTSQTSPGTATRELSKP